MKTPPEHDEICHRSSAWNDFIIGQGVMGTERRLNCFSDIIEKVWRSAWACEYKYAEKNRYSVETTIQKAQPRLSERKTPLIAILWIFIRP